METPKFSLLSELNAEPKKPKKKFQVYEVAMGFEKIEVVIPFANIDSFEKDLITKKPMTQTGLKKVLGIHEGYIKE